MTREEAIRILASSCISGSKQTEALETLIPELAESEDERIRKALINALKVSETIGELKFRLSEPTKEKAIAYLEKQKEASKAIEAVERIDKYIDEYVENAHDMKDSHPDKKYCQGIDDTLAGIAWILQDVYSNEKQKEQKSAEKHDLVAQLKEHLANTPKEQLEAEWKELEKWNHVGPTVEEYLGSIKPAEWSEEDEEILKLLILNIGRYMYFGGMPSERILAFLKSLRPQYHGDVTMTEAYKMGKEAGEASHWKPSKKEITAFEDMLKGEFPDKIYPGTTLSELLVKLKKLYYNESIPSWKPSEEQMNALEETLETYKGFEEYDAMKSLFEQLKKL